ncbi:MAG: porin family protein [Zetaproteobacteria bacterium CG12_big_fil_rev_8_21_14_0_65_54_13]|nr:MAG: hypothetical protein COX55_10175 [Zetaproteobacteria bacterium CG23_combo_of_CG06-09_8_20_14_all_54_7]PIW50780.1 MAG: porin family protein [Zetaproteobacteria bacterium CG12_big_fil_rev_8_21_14_0_65_54_13]PIX54293.1 MAG: porin family protein [Zetaproteobacteria bacterium CG_4_10_14_3_um_filter_54_28]PJA29921.1 MAG: porin family protein [Zetaproteobacteria bacterium CG_4_9_14_3_um_filter_54_145]
MKKMIITAALAATMACTATAAQAQDPSYYAGLGLGTITTDYKAAGIDQKKSSVGGYLKAGADFNDYFAAELRIGMTGKNKKSYAAGNTLSFSSPLFVAYLAKIKYSVASDLDMYMLAGATTARIKGQSVTAGVTATQTQTKTGLSLGAGFDYKLDNQTSVGAEWVQYMFPVKLGTGSVFAAGSKARMWGITGTATYHF